MQTIRTSILLSVKKNLIYWFSLISLILVTCFFNNLGRLPDHYSTEDSDQKNVIEPLFKSIEEAKRYYDVQEKQKYEKFNDIIVAKLANDELIQNLCIAIIFISLMVFFLCKSKFELYFLFISYLIVGLVGIVNGVSLILIILIILASIKTYLIYSIKELPKNWDKSIDQDKWNRK
ncbi:hypothetical protein [Pseudoalteromonas sp. MTN2-4]|uniref:hypothetical protein n=1 Tax=Pseudoalteromonas sp. MTN2-4 TaxID=3056555 RepID=UPI0036F22810